MLRAILCRRHSMLRHFVSHQLCVCILPRRFSFWHNKMPHATVILIHFLNFPYLTFIFSLTILFYVTGPSTVINAIAAGKVAAVNIDAYLGYNHKIKCDIDIPQPRIMDEKPCGRTELTLRYASERGADFLEIEQGMTREESIQEASRCLRCDHYGFGAFRGGRVEKW